jgi:hypothetical protein
MSLVTCLVMAASVGICPPRLNGQAWCRELILDRVE